MLRMRLAQIIYQERRLIMVNESIVGKIASRVTAATRVPASGKEDPKNVAERIISTIFKGIDSINSVEEKAVMINGIRLDDIFIINEFKDFIKPSAVKFDPTDLNSVNLLIKESVTESFDYDGFVNAQLQLRSWFRSDCKSNVTPVSELRKVVSLYDIFPFASFTVGSDILCRADDKPFVPIRLLDHLSHMYRKSFYNLSVEEMLEDYVSDMFL